MEECHFITHGAENKLKWKNVYIKIHWRIEGWGAKGALPPPPLKLVKV